MSAEFDALKVTVDGLRDAVLASNALVDTAIAKLDALAAQIAGLGDAPTPEQLHALADEAKAASDSLTAESAKLNADLNPPPPTP